MTYEEVIDNLKYLISEDCTDTQHDFVEEIEVAIEALEKQIPKKPIIDEWKRVKCENEHNLPVLCRNRKMPFCPFCGQAIDWSVSE